MEVDVQKYGAQQQLTDRLLGNLKKKVVNLKHHLRVQTTAFV